MNHMAKELAATAGIPYEGKSIALVDHLDFQAAVRLRPLPAPVPIREVVWPSNVRLHW